MSATPHTLRFFIPFACCREHCDTTYTTLVHSYLLRAAENTMTPHTLRLFIPFTCCREHCVCDTTHYASSYLSRAAENTVTPHTLRLFTPFTCCREHCVCDTTHYTCSYLSRAALKWMEVKAEQRVGRGRAGAADRRKGKHTYRRVCRLINQRKCCKQSRRLV